MAQLEADCAPGLIAYSTLTKEYCVCRELDEAMSLFVMHGAIYGGNPPLSPSCIHD